VKYLWFVSEFVVNMPLNGLPPTLETILQPILQDQSLSSFKVECFGDKTVVVLRLRPTSNVSSQKHGDPINFHRKRPSQVARDKKRAEMHRAASNSKLKVATKTSVCQPFISSPCNLTDLTRPNNCRNFLCRERSTSKQGAVDANVTTPRADRKESCLTRLSVSDIDPQTTGSSEDSALQTDSASTSDIYATGAGALYTTAEQSPNLSDSGFSFYHHTFCYQCRLQRCFSQTVPSHSAEQDTATDSDSVTTQRDGSYCASIEIG
jgi:hypothetical protein